MNRSFFLRPLPGLALITACLIICIALMSLMARPSGSANLPRSAATLEASAGTASARFKKKPAVLIFSKTNGYHHASIAAGIVAIKKLGAENGFDVDATDDSTWFRKNILHKYAALIFLSPTGKVFGPEEETALQDYIRHGGGFVGIHAATDCEYNWQWYGDLVGGYFKSHPKQQPAKLLVVDKAFPATTGMPDTWDHFDEWYNFKYLSPDIKVLIKIDEKSYTGGENGDNHPMSWYHAYDGGRSFYTEMGHTDACYTDTIYLNHLLGGIKYAIGKK